MKISFLSGAYQNAGDFLIEKRAIQLIKHVFPEAKINKYLRNQISNHITEINDADAVIFGGGPLYKTNLDGYLPLNKCINDITPPMMILGCGWCGLSGNDEICYQYKFNSNTFEFLKKIDNEGLGLGCRDLYTVKILKNLGLKNVFMTGCPAWYGLDYKQDFEQEALKKDDIINKIAVSDPAKPINFENALLLVKYLKEKFTNSEIIFIFHRKQDNPKHETARIELSQKIEKLGVKIKDISMNHEGFEQYDQCDLHIGFRVHAHIYNLSHKKKTILIEEDGRGAGVNQALGIPSLKAYNFIAQIPNKYIRKICKVFYSDRNKHLIEDVNSYLDLMQFSRWKYLKNAYVMQDEYLLNMVSFIKRLENKI